MAKQVAFTNLVLDDNDKVISNKKDDVNQEIIFSVSNGEWKKVPINNNNVTHKNNNNNFDFYKLFSSIFLPIGYPLSVTSDYGVFQICDTIQALCSYLRGLLTTRSTLIGIGVGKSTANATSATIQFIFRDLTGLIGSVLFSWKYSYSFGVEIKQWRLFADVINDIALSLELVSPLFPSICFVPILCVASICKAMCGCSAGATRVGIAKHFAKNDNETDIISKEGIQETFVTVLGMIFGLILTSFLNNNQYEFIIILFTFVTLTVVHIIANYFAVKSLQLNTLNRERLNILISHYLQHKKQQNILTPKQVCNFENVWKVNLFPLNYLTNFIFNSEKDNCFRLHLGIKINEISQTWMEWNLNQFKKNQNNYYFDIEKNDKQNQFDINIAYNVNANDMDYVASFLISKIIKEWMWNQRRKNQIKPDLSLKLLSEKEMSEFKQMLHESKWKISNLTSSLCVMPNRYSINTDYKN